MGLILNLRSKSTGLHHRLIELNLLVKNKIWISLATCYGSYIYYIIRPWDRCPFYGFVGPWEPIDIIDLQASFEKYFDTLLDNFDLKGAVEQLNLDNPRRPTEYKLYTSKEVFDRVYTNYDNNFDDKQKFENRVQEIANEAMLKTNNTLDRDYFVETARELLLETREEYKMKYRGQFFMTDLFPENKERFE